MSLFPAYSNDKNSQIKHPKNNDKWLQNESYQINVVAPTIIDTIEETTSIIVNDKKRKHQEKTHGKHKKVKKFNVHKKDETLILQTSTIDDIFIIDKTRNKEFLNVVKISNPSVPKYVPRYWINLKKFKKHKIKRYFQKTYKHDDKSNSEDERITRQNIDQIKSNKDENFTGFKQEIELTENTAHYNKELAKNPHNIKIWLDYVNFQDVIYQFEKIYRKGSIAKGLRVMAEKKLTILDKALNHNNNCEELLRERLNICVSTFPADELQSQLKTLLDKDQSNIIFWQGYIESYQCSMSHCNIPKVLNLYSKCLEVLHKLRRTSTMEKAQLEENILKILYQCGLFLKQAGLFEQLWTVIKLYLELNLAPTDKNVFNFISDVNENDLVELEEFVFKSELPLHELWLRTEKLRESCHWLPYCGDKNCEDPQRLVFNDDVAELIHPITMPQNTFKLIATILNLLKIPLLPNRHTTFQELGLDYVPWSLDSIECLLSIYFNIYPIDLLTKHLIIDNRLSVGPQYLKTLPGQEEYIHFILAIMKSCAECLKNNDKIVTTIWWMRFQRLLLSLENLNLFKAPQNLKKIIKINIKNLLKMDENRNNLLYFSEYALIEYELNNINSCLNILKTVLSQIDNKKKISAIQPSFEQSNICSVNRTLIEIYLKEKSNDLALQHLITYVLEKKQLINEVTNELIEETSLKLKHIYLLLLEDPPTNITTVEHFLPNFFVDWIILYGWFIYLTQQFIKFTFFLEETLEKIPCSFYREVIYEFYIAVIFKYYFNNPNTIIYKKLEDILYKALELYPNNLFLLSALAREQSIFNCVGPSWWKLKNLLIKSGRALSMLFLIIISNQQIIILQKNLIDTLTGTHFEINTNFKNRMLSLFQQITKADMCTRRCGLIWRLYLQFIYTYFDSKLCRNVYYTAVEECPWLKALYIDAAIYIPAELAQIQDLLIEKELRLHVTPEELEVLRS